MRLYALPLALLALGPSAHAGQAPDAATDAPKVAGQDVPAPRRTRFVEPDYPDEARAVGQRGIVIVQVVIDEEGKVASAEVARSVPPFDEPALAAVRKWEYEVTKVGGKPVKVLYTFPITFTVRLPEVTRQEGIPEMRQGVAPPIPTDAPLRKLETAVVEVSLDTDGSVAQAELRRGDPPWSEALLYAVRTWSFVPSSETGTLSFRVQADFVPAKGGDAAAVLLFLSSPRRSISYETAEAGGTDDPAPDPGPEPPTEPDAESPRPAGDETTDPTGATPPAASEERAIAPPTPRIEVLPGPGSSLAPGSAAPGSAEPGVSAVHDVILSNGVPDLLKGRRPVSPPLARMNGRVGRVEVRFSVDAGGSTAVQDTAGPEVLRPAADAAVASWSFRRISPERLFLVAVFDYGAETVLATVSRQ